MPDNADLPPVLPPIPPQWWQDRTQRFQIVVGNHGRVSRHHQYRHRFSDSPPDTQHHAGRNARDGIRNHYLIYSLPLRRSQRQTGFAHGTRAISHRIFRHRNDGGQRHNGKHNAARQPALAYRQVEHLLQNGTMTIKPKSRRPPTVCHSATQ